MPIRDRLSRIIRKSGSSSGSSSAGSNSRNSSSDGHSERRYSVFSSSTNTFTTASTTSPMPKTPGSLVRSYTSSAHSRLSKRTTAWLSGTTSTTAILSSSAVQDDLHAFSPGSKKPDPKRSTKPAVKSYHPSERRLNERNLRHQEVLGSFTMKFGRRRFSLSERSIISEVSPGNSRAASLDIPRGSCQVLEEDGEGPCGQPRRMSSSVDDGPADLGTISDFDTWAAGVLGMLSVDNYIDSRIY